MRTPTAGTRQRIFDCAARLFCDQRFHEVRMDDLAAEAEVSKGTLYRYFRDKEDLYLALVDTACRQILGKVNDCLEEVAAPEAKLEKIAATLIEYFDAHPYFFDLLQHVEVLHKGLDFPWSQTRQEMLDGLTSLFADPAVDATEPRACALMFSGAIRALTRFGERPRPDDLPAILVRTFLHGAAAASGAEEQKAARR